ncbi:MAG: translocon subunit [Watsoniomyces obsoletus]|nr:MAG: translocon subunit [Watsoniomyces obsoletus]
MHEGLHGRAQTPQVAMGQPADRPGTPTSFTSTTTSLPCPIKSGELVKPGTVASQIRKWDQRVHHHVAHPRYHVSSLWHNGLQARVKQGPLGEPIYGNPLAASSTPNFPTTQQPISTPTLPITQQPFSAQDAFLETGTRSSFGKRHGGGWAPPAGRRLSARNKDESAALRTADAQSSPRGRPRAVSSSIQRRQMASTNGPLTPDIPDELACHVSDIAEETESQLGGGPQSMNDFEGGLSPSRSLTPVQLLRPSTPQQGTSHHRSPSTGQSQHVERAPSSLVSPQPSSGSTTNRKRLTKGSGHLRGQHSLSQLDTGKKAGPQARRMSESRVGRSSGSQKGRSSHTVIYEEERSSRADTLKPAKAGSSRSTSKHQENRPQPILGGSLVWSPESYGSRASGYQNQDRMQALDERLRTISDDRLRAFKDDRLRAEAELEWRRFSYASDLDERASRSLKRGDSSQAPREQTPSQASLRALLHPRDSTETLKGTQSSPSLRKQASTGGLLSLIPRFFGRTESSPSTLPEATAAEPPLQQQRSSPFRADPVGERPSQRPQQSMGGKSEMTNVPTPVTPSARVSDNDSQDVHPPTSTRGGEHESRPKLQKSVTDYPGHADHERSRGDDHNKDNHHRPSRRATRREPESILEVNESGSPSRRRRSTTTTNVTGGHSSRHSSRHTSTHRVSIIDSQGQGQSQSQHGGEPAKVKHIHIMVSRDEWIDVQMSIRVQPGRTNRTGGSTRTAATSAGSRNTSVSVTSPGDKVVHE